VFDDVRVCRDGIEFAIGRYYQADAADIDFDNLPALVQEEVTLFRYTPGIGAGTYQDEGQTVLDEPFSAIPLVGGVDAITALAPHWGEAEPGFLYPAANLQRVTRAWIGGARLRPGTELIGRLGFVGGSEQMFGDVGSDSPLVVQRCKVFKAAKAKVDVRPGDRQNLVDPGSTTPVPFAILSDRGFDATLTDPATVRIGSAPFVSASAADVDGDGDFDFTATFVPAAAGIACGQRKALMSASSFFGWPIKGTARLRTTC
jgi:hypothetical protein